ncbi:hypothetical protein ACLOJK_012935 [Asimina triloba]
MNPASKQRQPIFDFDDGEIPAAIAGRPVSSLLRTRSWQQIERRWALSSSMASDHIRNPSEQSNNRGRRWQSLKAIIEGNPTIQQQALEDFNRQRPVGQQHGPLKSRAMKSNEIVKQQSPKLKIRNNRLDLGHPSEAMAPAITCVRTQSQPAWHPCKSRPSGQAATITQGFNNSSIDGSSCSFPIRHPSADPSCLADIIRWPRKFDLDDGSDANSGSR